MSSNPQNLRLKKKINKLAVEVHTCNASTEEVETRDRWGSLDSQPSLIGEPQAPLTVFVFGI